MDDWELAFAEKSRQRRLRANRERLLKGLLAAMLLAAASCAMVGVVALGIS